MSTKEDILFFEDTILVEKLAKIELGLQILAKTGKYEGLLVKEAGLQESLQGAAEGISSTVKGLIDTSSTGAIIRSVITKLLIPGALWKWHPLLGIVYSAANAIGLDPDGVVKKITDPLIPKIQSGEPITKDDINASGRAQLKQDQTQQGQLFQAEAKDPFSDIKLLEEKGLLVNASFQKDAGGGLLGVFRLLGLARGHNLLVGFIIWALKIAFISVGLMAGAGAVAGAAGVYQGQSTQPGTSTTTSPLKPSGFGTAIRPNNKSQIWWVPVSGLSGIRPMLLQWATQVYPELRGYESIISNTKGFENVYSQFVSSYDVNRNVGQLSVPLPYTSIKQVVDQFAHEAYVQLPKGGE